MDRVSDVDAGERARSEAMVGSAGAMTEVVIRETRPQRDINRVVV